MYNCHFFTHIHCLCKILGRAYLEKYRLDTAGNRTKLMNSQNVLCYQNSDIIISIGMGG